MVPFQLAPTTPVDPLDPLELLQENHYYPFGMSMEGPWARNEGQEQRYLFNGTERNEDFELNWDLTEFRS